MSNLGYEENSTKLDNDEMSTLLPTAVSEFNIDETNEVTLILAYVAGFLCIIALIFLLAICMDCRQQKIDNNSKSISSKRKNVVQRILPKFGWGDRREDQHTIVDKMQDSESTSTANAIV